jgi:hypothetical protein
VSNQRHRLKPPVDRDDVHVGAQTDAWHDVDPKAE